jgi:putative transposase
MPNYRRMHVPGGTYFFTVNLLERRRRLLVERADDLRVSFRATHAARAFELLAIVVLPDHLHCVWRLPTGDADNANRWAQIKSDFSRRFPVSEWRGDRRVACRERGV